MSTDDVDSFASMFSGPPVARRREREQRAKRERAAQRTDKQREREAIRTAQLNYRCSPDHKALVHAVKGFLGCSVADVMEEALISYAKAKGYEA